jgi:hypothetical protein
MEGDTGLKLRAAGEIVPTTVEDTPQTRKLENTVPKKKIVKITYPPTEDVINELNNGSQHKPKQKRKKKKRIKKKSPLEHKMKLQEDLEDILSSEDEDKRVSFRL